MMKEEQYNYRKGLLRNTLTPSLIYGWIFYNYKFIFKGKLKLERGLVIILESEWVVENGVECDHIQNEDQAWNV